jgi:predicted metal-dependent peptidase
MKPNAANSKGAADRLTRARATLILEQPFFGALALRLKLIEKNEIPTLAVDGTHIFYNAEFVKSLTPQLLKSAVCHEVGHCVFSHINRRGSRDPWLWNLSGDFVVNEMIKSSGMQIDEKWLWKAEWKDMTVDHIYNLLQEMKKEQQEALGDALCDIMQPGDSPGTPQPEGGTEKP